MSAEKKPCPACTPRCVPSIIKICEGTRGSLVHCECYHCPNRLPDPSVAKLERIRDQLRDWWNLLRTNPTLNGNEKLNIIQRILDEKDTP